MRLAALLTVLLTAGGVRADALAGRVDAIAQRALAHPVAGISIAVARDGKIVLARGYGFANLEHSVPVTPETVFHIASISNAAVARAALGLAEPALREAEVSKREAAALAGTFDSDEGPVELSVRGGKLRFRIPGQPGDHPVFRDADGTLAVDDTTEARYLMRDGKATWVFAYAAGLMLDAKPRTH